jgi:glutamyl-tRNA synthetase
MATRNFLPAAGVFDPEKLLSLSADHIRATPPEKLVEPLKPFLKRHGIAAENSDLLQKIIETLHARSKTLDEMAENALFYFADDIGYEEKAAKKFLKPAVLEALKLLVSQFEILDEFSEENLESAFKAVMDQTGLKLGKIAQPVRVALTGKVVSRLKKAIRFIEERSE